uniref:Immunoglobulin domain-containing protein n=1 Tax=Salarias fasciatus TaxID=181472 RepID=A0A672I0L5_SALFA
MTQFRLPSVHTDACFPAVLTEGTTIRVEGVEGGSVSFQCSHRLAWGYNKYFCVDPCESSSIEGRFDIRDSPRSKYFYVYIKNLTKSDSGTYWCGFEETLQHDSYTKIQLTVGDHFKTFSFSSLTVKTPASFGSSFFLLVTGSTSMVCSHRPPADLPMFGTVMFIIVPFIFHHISSHSQTAENTKSVSSRGKDQGVETRDSGTDKDKKPRKKPRKLALGRCL